jgi:outer membrane protein assembly factor BamB
MLRRTVLAIWFALCSGWLLPLHAEDWPMWGGDAGRQARLQTELPETLHLHWVRQLPTPRPAWRPQGDDGDKLEFDRSYSPIVLGDRVFVASMVSDRLTAYDLDSGDELWRYYTDGPLRLAPAAADGRLYGVSDDGCLYCLDVETGQLRWRFRAAPAPQRVLGNERVISMWPARGGPVIADGIVYFGAGIWPMHGTFLYALQADTGRVVWANTGDGAKWAAQPHGGAYAFAALAPQGYLAASEDRLVVSGGRTPPVLVDRQTGDLIHMNMRAKPQGGYQVRTDGQFYFNHGQKYRLSDGGAEGSGHLEDLELASRAARLQDQLDGPAYSILAAHHRLILTTDSGAMYCFGAAVDRPAIRHEESSREETTEPFEADDQQAAERAAAIIAETDVHDGYALFVGVGDGRRMEQLARQTDLKLIGIDTEPSKIQRLRRQWDDAGLYGTRIALLPREPGRLSAQYPRYISSLIVVQDPAVLAVDSEGGRAIDWQTSLAEIYDMLRPFGGQAILNLGEEAMEGSALQDALARFSPPGGRVIPHVDRLVLARDGAIPHTDDWTHQYADSANTVFSNDDAVRLPLGILWFGGPTNDDILPRHGHGPIPQVAAGRVILPGVDTITARDVYTGRQLWQASFPGLGHPFTDLEYEELYRQGRSVFMHTRDGLGANYIGSPYVSLPDAIYVRYRTRVHRLDPQTGQTVAEFLLPVPDDDRDRADWGHISVWENLLITTVEPHIFEDNGPGRHFQQMADIKGRDWSATSSRRIVVMDRHSGETLWTREAEIGFRHNTIVTAAGQLFLIDGLSDQASAALERRGRQPRHPTILALDAASGQVRWQNNEGVFGTWLGYSKDHDVLVQAGRRGGLRDLPDEPNSRIIALRGSTGQVLWQRAVRYWGALALHDRTIILAIAGRSGTNQGLDLLTGEDRMRQHPLTEQPTTWSYWRTYGCNTINASRNLLLFRSGAAGFADLQSDGGTGSFGGFRSGCTNNLIPANGVVNAPDYTRTCTCSYHQQTSLALVHMPDMDLWTVHPEGLGDGQIARLGINLGAPGNRRSEEGTLWVEYPPGGAPGADLDVQVQPEHVDWYRKHTLLVDGSEGHGWVAASGGEGVRSLRIGNLQPSRYRVRLHFCEPHLEAAGARVFDVSLQDAILEKSLDIVGRSGRPDRGIVLVGQADVDQDGRLVVDLSPSEDSTLPPVISGIELVAISPAVTTLAPTAITRDSATLQAELVRFDHAASAEAFFRWRQVGSDAWQTTPVRTAAGTGPFSETLDSLRHLQHYEVQAVARVDGQEIAGSIRSLIPNDMYAMVVDDHHIRVPHHAALNPGADSFTIEAWVQLESASDAGNPWDLIVAKRSPNGYYLGLRRGHGWNFMLRDDQGKRTDTQSHRPIAEIYDRWVFVQAVVDRPNQRQILRVFDPQEGQWHEAAVTPPGHIGTTDDLYFGKDVDAGQFATCGHLGPIRFWRTARTREDAQADMHDRLTGLEDYLVGYWSMQEGDGKRLGDHSANANHGTIIGGTWTSRLPVDPKQP